MRSKNQIKFFVKNQKDKSKFISRKINRINYQKNYQETKKSS